MLTGVKDPLQNSIDQKLAHLEKCAGFGSFLRVAGRALGQGTKAVAGNTFKPMTQAAATTARAFGSPSLGSKLSDVANYYGAGQKHFDKLLRTSKFTRSAGSGRIDNFIQNNPRAGKYIQKLTGWGANPSTQNMNILGKGLSSATRQLGSIGSFGSGKMRMPIGAALTGGAVASGVYNGMHTDEQGNALPGYDPTVGNALGMPERIFNTPAIRALSYMTPFGLAANGVYSAVNLANDGKREPIINYVGTSDPNGNQYTQQQREQIARQYQDSIRQLPNYYR